MFTMLRTKLRPHLFNLKRRLAKARTRDIWYGIEQARRDGEDAKAVRLCDKRQRIVAKYGIEPYSPRWLDQRLGLAKP